MDFLKFTQVDDVHVQRDKETYTGSVHLTQNVLLLLFNGEELWVHRVLHMSLSKSYCEDRRVEITKGSAPISIHIAFSLPYPIIHTMQRLPQNPFTSRYPLHIRCRDFMNLILEMQQDKEALAVFEYVQKLTCVDSIDKLYAFFYTPPEKFTSHIGWKIYDLKKESERMRIWSRSKLWRISDINSTYEFCPTYPKNFIVPIISDNVLRHAVKYRSRGRIPVLSYMHWNNMATISRSAQPLTGLKQIRSTQDEKMIELIFSSNVDVVPGQVIYGSTPTNIIVDARPIANAVGQTVTGAGTENMDNYKNCKKVFMGIENIHVMRESLARVCEAMQYTDNNNEKAGTGLNRLGLLKSGWLKHISAILDGSVTIVKNVHVFNSHVFVHCSDGWDRTAQVTSISELCLDPYYRTFVGFMVLVEKEWVSFGHKFADRCGHLSNEKYFVNLVSGGGVQQKFYKSNNHVRDTSPVFHQFLDCVYQIQRQHPNRFEFNEQFLIELHYHIYSCQFGTFLYNSECERIKDQADTRTQSVWDYFLTYKEKYIYEGYNPELDKDRKDRGVLMPDFKGVVFWARLFRRKEEELNEGWPQELVYGTGLGIERLEEKEKESELIEGSGIVVYRNGDSSSSEIMDPKISFIDNGAKTLDINSSQNPAAAVSYEVEDPWRNDDPLSAPIAPLPVPGTYPLKPALDFSFAAGSSFVNRFISNYTRSKSSLSTNSANGERELGAIDASGSIDESSKSGIPRQYLGNSTVLRSTSTLSDANDPLVGSTGEKGGVSSMIRRSTSPSLTDLPRSSHFSSHRLTSPSSLTDSAVTPILVTSTPSTVTNEKPVEIGVQVPSPPVRELPHPLHIEGDD